MVGKREGLAELLLSQSSEIAPALTPTNQAQTNLAHILPAVRKVTQKDSRFYNQ